MNVFDITKEFLSSPKYPDSYDAELKTASSISNGDCYNLSILTSSVHYGTHADAPLHFFNEGCDIASMPLEHYIGDCYVIEVCEGPLTADYFMSKFPSDARRILLKGNGKATLSEDCARALAASDIITIGTDYWSIAALDNECMIHKILLKEKIAIIEGLDLTNILAGKYFLSAAPLKIAGSDGAYVRALLIKF
jgi:arylformamidase